MLTTGEATMQRFLSPTVGRWPGVFLPTPSILFISGHDKSHWAHIYSGNKLTNINHQYSPNSYFKGNIYWDSRMKLYPHVFQKHRKVSFADCCFLVKGPILTKKSELAGGCTFTLTLSHQSIHFHEGQCNKLPVGKLESVCPAHGYVPPRILTSRDGAQSHAILSYCSTGHVIVGSNLGAPLRLRWQIP